MLRGEVFILIKISQVGWFLFFCILQFPWVRVLVGFDSDVQPIGFLVALCFSFFLFSYLLGKRKIIWNDFSGVFLTIFFISFLVVLLIFLIDGINTSSIRGGFQYSSLSLFSFVLFIVFSSKIDSLSLSKVLRFSIIFCFWIWVFVALIQFFYDRDFLTFLMTRQVLTFDRGVISLSSEPGYFGYVLIFYSLCFLALGRKLEFVVAFLSISLLTMSTVAVLVSFVIAIFYISIWLGRKTFFLMPFILLIFGFFGYFMIFEFLDKDSRMYYLMNRMVTDFPSLIRDGSFNIRITHFYYSHLGFLESIGIPNGVTSWVDYVDSRVGEIPYLWDSGTQQTSRINSGLGGILYEIGWFGVLLFGLNLVVFYKSGINRKESWFLCFFVIVMFYSGFNFRTSFLYLLMMVFCLRKMNQNSSCFSKRII